MKPKFIALAIGATGLAAGNPDTLIDPATRNGGFEDGPAGQTLLDAPSWDSFFAEGNSTTAVIDAAPHTGSRHGIAGGWQGTGNRVHPAQTIPLADWTIGEGDVFTVTFQAGAWTNFDAGSDKVQVILHVVDAAGNLVSDSGGYEFAADRLLSRDLAVPAADAWHHHAVSSTPVRAGSPWIGKRLRLRFLNTGDRNEFASLDEVSLIAGTDDRLQPALLAAAYAFDGDLQDHSANHRHGSGSPAFGTGFGLGKSLACGSGASASVPHAEPNSFSMSLRLKTTAPGSEGSGLRWDEGSLLVETGGGTPAGLAVRGNHLAFGTGSETLNSRTPVTDGAWHHVVATRSGATGAMQLFIDGRLEATGNGPAGAAGGSAPLVLGRTFSGLVDDLAIHRGILTVDEIDALRIGSGDTDGDGQSNADEEIAGTSPGDANNRLFVAGTALDAEGFHVQVDGKSDRGYRLLRLDGDTLAGPGQEVGESPVLDQDAPVDVTDPTPPADRAFYRVAAEKGVPVRPNILLIVSDDHGYADLGAYAHARPDIKALTPQLDRIAAGGMLFTQGYAAGPVCSPARAGLLTGRYQHEWDPGGGWTPGLPAHVPTIAEYLRDAGYATAHLGKNDLGKGFHSVTAREHPLRHGFQSFFGFSAHAHDYYLHSSDIASRTLPNPYDGSAHLGPLISDNGWQELPDGKWLPEELTDRAVSYLQARQPAPAPFFLQLSYNSVHSLIHQVPQPYLAAEGLPTIPDYDPAGTFTHYTNYYNGYSRSKSLVHDVNRRKYYRAHLRAFDDQVGRVLDALDATGLAGNTLVVYVSDNGGEAFTGANNLPLSGCKYNVFEGGIRIPFMMRWPGKIPAGTTYPHVVSALDLAPTFLDAARVRHAPNLRGHALQKPLRSLEPIVPGGRALFWRFNSYWAVRHGDWKLVFSDKGDTGHTDQIRFNPAALGKIALFDLATDPGETNDLAEDPAHAAIKADLKARYDAWQQSL